MGRSGTTSRTVRFALLAAVLGLLAAGCVERRVVIRSNPPGALVYVDDHEVGITPVAFSPIYYGNRKIRLVKDGCETKTVIEPMLPPWYEVPPLDFISENVVPGTLHDSRTLDFQLEQQRVVPKEELLARAEDLRRGTQRVGGVAAPGWRVNPPVAPGLRGAGWNARRGTDRQPAILPIASRAAPPAMSGPTMAPSPGLRPQAPHLPGQFTSRRHLYRPLARTGLLRRRGLDRSRISPYQRVGEDRLDFDFLLRFNLPPLCARLLTGDSVKNPRKVLA